jgi:protein involved in polysaccharide export with SLBB domain
VILLPASLLRDDRGTQLRQVLLHELGHVHQRDGWGSLLFCVTLPVLYFHPLYWWLRRGAELARELVADDWAARADGKEAYVTELVALARTRVAGSIGPVGAVGILQVRSHFYRRMRMLLQRHRPLATRCSTPCRAAMGVLAVALVIGMASVLGVGPARAQSATPADAAPAAEKVADVPADHVIGVGDLVSVSDADPNAPAKALRVNKDGNVTIPVLGSIKATGMTGAELERSIARTLRDKNLIPDAPITVRVVEARPAGVGAPPAIPAPPKPPLADPPASDASGGQNDSIEERMRKARLVEVRKARDLAVQRQRALEDAKRAESDAAAVGNAGTPAPGADGGANSAKRPPTGTRWPGGFTPAEGTNEKPAGADVAPAAGGTRAVVGGVQLDLVNLANSMVDAGGAVRLAKVNYEAHAQLAKEKGISNLELETSKANLETAAKRLNLLRSIAEVALQSAQDDFRRTKAMYEKGVGDQQSLSEATSKVKMLELIVAGAQ